MVKSGIPVSDETEKFRLPKTFLGRIQNLVKGGPDLRPPTLTNCYCCLTSPFFTRKSGSMVKIFAFVSL